MSAEEFTDKVFAKIDINGDGEGTRGGGGGAPRGRGQQAWRSSLPRRGQRPSAGHLAIHLCLGYRTSFGDPCIRLWVLDPSVYFPIGHSPPRPQTRLCPRPLQACALEPRTAEANTLLL